MGTVVALSMYWSINAISSMTCSASTCAKGFYPEAGLFPPPPPLPDHRELETMFSHYPQCRFQWLFTYWLFRQPSSFDRQLRAIYLQWRKHSKRKVASWGGTLCEVRYLASL